MAHYICASVLLTSKCITNNNDKNTNFWDATITQQHLFDIIFSLFYVTTWQSWYSNEKRQNERNLYADDNICCLSQWNAEMKRRAISPDTISHVCFIKRHKITNLYLQQKQQLQTKRTYFFLKIFKQNFVQNVANNSSGCIDFYWKLAEVEFTFSLSVSYLVPVISDWTLKNVELKLSFFYFVVAT